MDPQIITETQTGRLKWYNVFKNFGFVVAADSGEEAFVHHHDVIYPGAGECEHSRGFCVRAIALLGDEQQTEIRERFTALRLTQMLQGAPVKFRVVQTAKGLE